MEIENENKKEKKKFSFFCCFSTNCGRNNSRKKEIKEKKIGHNTVSTNVINKSNNSIKNISKPSVKEFFLSNEQEPEKKEGNSNKENNIYSNNSNNNISYHKNKNTFLNENNNINFSVISEKMNIKNKSITENMNKNILENLNKKNNKQNIYKNTSNKTYKTNNNNIISNNETSIEKGFFVEKSENKDNDECIKYENNNENNNETYSNDNVNIYDNNNRSYNKESEIKNNKKNLYKKKDSYMFNYNIKNNYYPTEFNLSLTSNTKKNNNINSVINFEPKLNLFVNNFLDNKSNCNIQNKDDTIIMKEPTIQQEINIIPQKTKYKLNYSKSYNNLNKKNNLYKLDNINIKNRSGIFFISQNNLNLNQSFSETKIKFGFKYEKIPINITEIKHDELEISITKEKNMTFNDKKNKSQNKAYIDNNLLKFKTDEKINKKINILSKSQKDFDNIEYKLNYIDENYFKVKNNNTNNTNIIKNEINKDKENIDINNNINKNNEKEKEKNLIANNILDLEGDIESVDEEEESKKINDSKSIISNYIISPLLPHNEKIRSNTQSIFSRTDLNFNFREFKENISNFNEIMSNKGSFIPNSNYNETEIEIMNENGKEFSSFIETPRASGVYNKKIKNKNTNYNFNMTNTYNFKNMNLKMKKIKDKINQSAKDIQKTNEKINKLDEQIKEYENCSKQYEMWIEKEEEESEILINMINFLNSNRK